MEYFRARHELVYIGLNYGRVFGVDGQMKWSEVTHVRYNGFMKWFKLESRSGATARVSTHVTGIPAFASAVLANVSADVIDRKTLKILEETANGKPPEL